MDALQGKARPGSASSSEGDAGRRVSERSVRPAGPARARRARPACPTCSPALPGRRWLGWLLLLHRPRLIQYACRYATYSGSLRPGPAAVGCSRPGASGGPGTWTTVWLGCETRWLGCWPIWASCAPDATVSLSLPPTVFPPRGWIRVVLSGLFRPGTNNTRPVSEMLVAGERVLADIVVCGADSARLYRDLYPSRAMRRRIAGSVCLPRFLCWLRYASAPLGSLTTRLLLRGLPRGVRVLFDRRLPPPTFIYECAPRPRTRRALRPHTSTLLVNVPAGSPKNWGWYAADYGELLWPSWTLRASACATGFCSPRRSARLTSNAATTAGWARSTGPRTTAGWRRSAAGHRGPLAGRTWSAGRCIQWRAAAGRHRVAHRG